MATLSSIICFELAATWLFTPWLVPLIWGVEDSYTSGLFGRQAGALFLAIAVMFLLARNADPSPGRDAIIQGFICGCAALVVLSLYELATGHAGFGILSAVLVELALAVGFAVSLWRERRANDLNDTRP